MGSTSNEPIRLSSSQTELLTRALAEAVRQAAIPKSSETEIVKKQAATPVSPSAKPPKRATII